MKFVMKKQKPRKINVFGVFLRGFDSRYLLYIKRAEKPRKNLILKGLRLFYFSKL